jgi:3-oxoacyl-[acyl-carrier protein] reductase
MTTKTLLGKVAIVTGSSRGIGRAIAERLGQRGANVVVTYRQDREQADQVVAAIEQSGSSALAVQTDLLQLEDIRNLFTQARERFGRVDILVNNAAVRTVFRPTAQMTQADYDSMFGITRGVYFALQQAALHLADGGRVINLSSAGTAMSMAGGGAYAGSKAAIEQFTGAMAKELGHRGITVNAVSPGVTQTDGLVLDPAQVAQLVAQTPLGRLGQPDDIAGVVALLVSDQAGWITGQNIRATGGHCVTHQRLY